MRRILIAMVACAGATGLLAPALSGAAASKPPRALLRSFVCQTARDPAGRGISVTAVMKPLAHTRRMAIRFDLLERRHRGGPERAVIYQHLGRWIRPSDPSLGQRPGDRFILTEPVLQLAAPAYYRFRVRFRWNGAHGKVLGTATRYSSVCFQPELRPDLRVTAIHVQRLAKHPAKNLYVAVIRNTGASAVGDFVVRFADPGRLTKDKTVSGLGAHRKATVTFTGPACQAASPPSITADPGLATDDFNRANNTLTASCPAS